MNWKIPLFKIAWDEEDVKAVSSVIRRGMFWAIGPEIEQFEEKIAGYSGRKYALAFSNGTCALHAALAAHGIKEGDEVIVPSFTFISTANSALFLGAKPVFADIEEGSYALDAEDVKERIGPKTRAIMPVHYGGAPARDSKALADIAEDKGLVLIEDAAEAMGAVIDGKKAGTFGHSAMFSFCANKVISTGEGGAVVTDSRELFEKMKLLRSHGRLETVNYFDSSLPSDYIQMGYNFRMSAVTAALGMSQMGKIEANIRRRNDIAGKFSSLLSDIKDIATTRPPEKGRHVFQLFSIRFREKEQKDKVMEALTKSGIMCKTYFDPVHLSYFYKKVLKYRTRLPVTEAVAETILSLPIYPGLKENEINDISEAIHSCW